MSQYLFVYGTLKRGFYNHTILLDYKGNDSTFIRELSLPGYDMYSLGGFPGVVLGKGQITGELYKVNDEILCRTDRLEGVNAKFPYKGLYRREKARMISEDQFGTWNYWIYLYNGDVSTRQKIEDGVWRK